MNSIVTEANKRIVRRILDEYWRNGHAAVIDDLFTEDHVNYDLSDLELRGRDAFREWANGIRMALNICFPGWHVIIKDLVAERNLVAKQWVFHGIHRAGYFGIKPTGKQVTMRAVTMYHFADGKVKESWWNYDLSGLLQQIVGIPTIKVSKEPKLTPDQQVAGKPR